MNSMQVKDKLRNISNDKKVNFNLVLRNYMYERFVERLSHSRYRDNFILKGGYCLSLYFGIDFRHTMDIDFCLKNEKLSEENIKSILEEIVSEDVGDNAVITLGNISRIREEDEYGGYRIMVTIKMDNIRETFNLDIATGDPITPKEISFKYRKMIDCDYINLQSYNLETILAEKLEAILSKKDLSSRLKDYYDIYLIYKMFFDNINQEHLRKAVENTFEKRSFNDNVVLSLKVIKDSEILRIRWNAYSRKNKFAENITYDEIMVCLEKLIEIIQPVLEK